MDDYNNTHTSWLTLKLLKDFSEEGNEHLFNSCLLCVESVTYEACLYFLSGVSNLWLPLEFLHNMGKVIKCYPWNFFLLFFAILRMGYVLSLLLWSLPCVMVTVGFLCVAFCVVICGNPVDCKAGVVFLGSEVVLEGAWHHAINFLCGPHGSFPPF